MASSTRTLDIRRVNTRRAPRLLTKTILACTVNSKELKKTDRKFKRKPLKLKFQIKISITLEKMEKFIQNR
jgi:hypothetical protein